jgi:hypothetical protein
MTVNRHQQLSPPEDERGWKGQVIKGLTGQPAFLLIFGICLVFGLALTSYGVATGTPFAFAIGLASVLFETS